MEIMGGDACVLANHISINIETDMGTIPSLEIDLSSTSDGHSFHLTLPADCMSNTVIISILSREYVRCMPGRSDSCIP